MRAHRYLAHHLERLKIFLLIEFCETGVKQLRDFRRRQISINEHLLVFVHMITTVTLHLPNYIW